MRILLKLACVVAALTTLALPAMALTTFTSVDMVTTFNHGTTEQAVDAYKGTTGNGWLGWEERQYNLDPAPYTNFLVRTSAETPGTYDDDYAELVSGSGNYLYVDANLASAGSGTVARNYSGKLGIDLTQSYSIDFLYRVEESATNLASTFTTINDRYSLFDYPEIRTGITTGCGWVIAAHGGSDTWMNDPGYWVLFNGQGHLGDVTNTADKWVNSGIAISAGQTLSFHLDIDPVNKLWNATITDLADPLNPFSYNGLGWRIDTSASGDPTAVLSGLTQFAGQGSADDDERQFSIDALHVQQSSCSWTVGGMNQVAAHFNDGETDLLVDGFGGKAGGGWNSAWNTQVGRCTLNTAVKGESDNPLHAGDGNYLEMIVNGMNPGTTGYSVGGVTRDYACVNENGIDWTKDHTVEFSVRIDDDLSTFSDTYDKYQIFDQAYERGGTCGNTLWGAYVDGDGSGFWSFTDGHSSAQSTIGFTSGTVYDFTIDINIAARTYTVTLTDGTGSFTDTFDWRCDDIDYVGGVLHFMARGNASDDVRAWSIDEIIITESMSIPGDTNGDNIVDETDATTVASNWGNAVPGGASVGDFNGDGFVDATDASIMAANWGDHNEGEGNAVPEPGSLILLGFGVLMLAVTRRREH